MKSSLIILGLFISLSFSSCPAAVGEPLKVKTQLSSHRINVGETVKFSIVVFLNKDLEIDFSDSAKALGQLTIKDSGVEKRQAFGNKRIVQWYLFSVYATGKVEIPKLPIKYRYNGSGDWKTIETPRQEIIVRSVLEKVGTGATLRDIEGPLEVSSPLRASLGLVIILILLASVTVGIALFMRQRKLLSAQLSLRSPYEIALQQLEALQSKDLIAQEMFKEYFFEISHIIRHYLENRFQVHAPEMTTQEFIEYAKEYGQLGPEHKALLREFLVACDMVKFARYLPSLEEAGSVYTAAKKFLDQTKL